MEAVSCIRELSRYLHLNPVRADMAAANRSYPAARRASSTLAPSLHLTARARVLFRPEVPWRASADLFAMLKD